MFDSWLEMGENKYIGIEFYPKRQQINFLVLVKDCATPLLVYRMLWHNVIKILGHLRLRLHIDL